MIQRLADRRPAALPACALAVVLMTSGCSSQDPSPQTRVVEVEGATFSGAWAQEFAQGFEKATSPFVKHILRDGEVTDAELAEVTEKYRTCLTASGITYDGQDSDGGTRFSFPLSISADDANRDANSCGEESGEDAVAGIYFEVRRNPLHLDENTIMAACLAKKGLVSASYDADQYAADSAAGTFPFSGAASSEASFQDCVADPLGRTAKKK